MLIARRPAKTGGPSSPRFGVFPVVCEASSCFICFFSYACVFGLVTRLQPTISQRARCSIAAHLVELKSAQQTLASWAVSLAQQNFKVQQPKRTAHYESL